MIKVHYGRSTYYTKLRNLTDNVIIIKFDTGAVNTVISLEALTNNKNIDKNKLIKQLENSKKSHIFKSASGNDMIGYLCNASNVKISGVNIKDFYYYLIVNTEQSLALLGDDFISCCSFNHSINSDIIINAFNDKLYKDKQLDTYIDELELHELLSLCCASDLDMLIVDENDNVLTEDEIEKELYIDD